MPTRGGRSGGGGSRSSRSSTPRSSSRSSSGSSGSRGFHVNFGNRTPRATTSIPNTDTTDNDQTYRPNMYPRTYGPSGPGLNWKTIAIIVGVILLGVCACAVAAIVLQSMGYLS